MLAGSTTTVQLSRKTIERLGAHREPFDKSWDEVVNRVLNLEGEVFIEPIMIDGEYAKSSDHVVIFQIGDAPPHYYAWKNGVMEEVPLPKMKMEVVDPK